MIAPELLAERVTVKLLNIIQCLFETKIKHMEYLLRMHTFMLGLEWPKTIICTTVSLP